MASLLSPSSLNDNVLYNFSCIRRDSLIEAFQYELSDFKYLFDALDPNKSLVLTQFIYHTR